MATTTETMKDKHNKVIAEQTEAVMNPKKLYTVVNITKEIQPPGWTLNLSKGQIPVGEEGIATLAEVQNMSGYIKVVD
jgi:hypothetical protein